MNYLFNIFDLQFCRNYTTTTINNKKLFSYNVDNSLFSNTNLSVSLRYYN